jgi:hypothetical protein
MVNKIKLLLVLAALAALLTPSLACAYGAAHVGYTHVGPNGVYHEGATVAGGYGGGYGGGTAYHVGPAGGTYAGGAYVGGATHVGPAGGTYGGGYGYHAGYAGYGTTNYGYVR